MSPADVDSTLVLWAEPVDAPMSSSAHWIVVIGLTPCGRSAFCSSASVRMAAMTTSDMRRRSRRRALVRVLPAAGLCSCSPYRADAAGWSDGDHVQGGVLGAVAATVEPHAAFAHP